jgi:hypothetical protein
MCNACTYANLPSGYSVECWAPGVFQVKKGTRYLMRVQPDRYTTRYAARHTFTCRDEAVAYCVDHAHKAV